MRTIPVGRTGEQVSQLALGCMLMGTSTDAPNAYAILDRYVAAGGSFLDTAACYAWWAGRGGQDPVHRLGERDHVAAGADPAALRPVRLARTGCAPAGTHIPAQAPGPRHRLRRRRR